MEEGKKKSAERRKREVTTATDQDGDEQNKLQQVDEKGEENDDLYMPVKELQKKAQEFVKENFDKYITKKKPKAKQSGNKWMSLFL